MSAAPERTTHPDDPLPPDAPQRQRRTRFMVDREAEIHKILDHQFHHPRPDGKCVSAQELAEQFGVAKRTIYRDIQDMIITRGLPIEQVAGAKGGYRYSRAVAEFPNLELSEGELFVLTLATQALSEQSGTASEKTVRKVMEKLFTAVDSRLTTHLRRLEERVTFRPGGYEVPLELRTFETILQALLREEELHFSHTRAEPEATPQRRRVQPRHLISVASAWYLFADDLDRDGALRHFALSRMTEVRSTGRCFTPKKRFHLQRALKGSMGIHTDGESEVVRLVFTPRVRQYVLERRWHADQQVRVLADGRVELTLRTLINPELNKWIRSWGPDVRVMEPARLRQDIVEEARRVLALYESLDERDVPGYFTPTNANRVEAVPV